MPLSFRAGGALVAAAALFLTGSALVATTRAPVGSALVDYTVQAQTTTGPAPVGVASTPGGSGWVVATVDGGVSTFGDAGFWGSAATLPLKAPIVGITTTPSGQGYWLVASDGGIFSFGDAAFHGSTGAIHLNRPIVGMATTPSGQGYWLVASDGGVFSFGDAAFYGSTGGIRLARPVAALSATRSGHGYLMIATDGGIFTFGDSTFRGSAAGTLGADSARALVATPTGAGYWIVTTGGRALPFGDAPAVSGPPVNAPVAGATLAPGPGVRLVASNTTSSVWIRDGSPAPSSLYSWMLTNTDGSPVRWNPCTAIHYVTNLGEAPPQAPDLVAQAVSMVSSATGIAFVNDGTTTTVPNSQSAVQPNPDGTWKPVVIGWARPSETDLLPGGNVIGVGGPAWSQTGGQPKVYVSGNVLIDSDNTGSLAPSFGDGTTLGELLLHELGHLVGLGHTGDSAQIMYPTILPLPSAAYGQGDLAGLGAVGASAGCVTTPPA